MAFEGKLVKSRRKVQFSNEQKTTFTPKRLQFATQMTAGQTDIVLTSLVAPPGMPGFTSSSTPDLLSAHIYSYKSNVTLTRSDGSLIIPYMEYLIIDDQTIRLLTPAALGTVVYGTIEAASSSGVTSVDGFNIIATGQLGLGSTDVVVGMPFKLFANPSSQIGSVLVFRNGRLMLRNDGNVTAGPAVTVGNYQELPTGVGLTNTIRFNRPGGTLTDGNLETYTIVSNGIVALQPTEGILAVLDSLGGQMDQVIAVLAAVSGNPTSFFQANPNQVDLRVFGNRVIALEEPEDNEVYVYALPAVYASGGNFIPTFGITGKNSGTAITYLRDTVNGDTFTVNQDGVYSFVGCLGYSATANILGFSKNSNQLNQNITTINPINVMSMTVNGPPNSEANVVFIGRLKKGDVVRMHMTGASLSTNSTSFGTDQFVRCCKVGN